MPFRWARAALLFLTAAVSSLAPRPLLAQTALKEAVPHIVETGYAETKAVPDVAILTLGVTTKRQDASQAASDNAVAVQAVLTEIKGEGINAKDVQTISAQLAPTFEEQRDASGRLVKRVQTGYEASQGLEVRVHALDQAGVLALRLIKKGANELQNLHFDYEHKTEVYDRLRGDAMRDALRRAKAHVTAAGLTLGRILEIAPQDANEPVQFTSHKMAALAPVPAPGAMGIPMTPGTLTFTSQVPVVWELQP